MTATSRGDTLPGKMGITRRGFVTGWLALLSMPVAVEAQEARKTYQVGWLTASSASTSSPELVGVFRHAFQELGWVEGRNITIAYRYADGQLDRLAEMAAELVGMNVDVIVATVSATL